MKKLYFLFFMFFISLFFMHGCSCTASLDPDVLTSTFSKTFGGTGYDEGYSIIQLSDKTFMIAGKENVSGSDQGYIAHIDTNGNAIWQKTYSSASIFRDIFPIDSGFAAVGNSGANIYVLEIDSAGNQINDYTSFVSGTGYAGCADGSDVVAVGSTNGSKGCYILKLNNTLGKLFAKSFSTNNISGGYDIIKGEDGNYYIAGFIATTNTGNQAMLLKVNTSCDRIWSKFYGGSSDDYFYALKQRSDSSIILAGRSSYQAYLVRTDSDGNILWEKTYGGSQYDDIQGISLTASDDIIAAGSTQNPSEGGFDIYLLNIRAYDGSSVWTKNFGTVNDERGYDAVQCSDYGFAAVGSSAGDIFIMKVDPLGNQER